MDVICDIDGTIANMEHRRMFLHHQPKDWPQFFSNMINDEPIAPMVELIRTLWVAKHNIIFCTGRPDEYRDVTMQWLRANVIPPTNLYMRKTKDYRDDGVVKLELLEQIRKNGFNPVIAFEDRDRVVKVWRDAGLICAQVAPGDF